MSRAMRESAAVTIRDLSSELSAAASFLLRGLMRFSESSVADRIRMELAGEMMAASTPVMRIPARMG